MKLVFRVTIFLILAVILFAAGLSYSGFCFKEKRFLSDEEKINVAVADVLRSYPPNVPYENVVEGGERKKIRTNRPPKFPIPYRDIKEFFDLNPGCCKVVMQGTHDGEFAGVNFFDKLFGRTSCLVEMSFVVRYRDESGVVHSHLVKTIPAISNCGYLWNNV